MAPPNGCLCPVPWVQTPVGGGYEAPGRLNPPAQQLARRRQAYSSSWCGGEGRVGAVRGPSALLAARTACMSRQWVTRARTARAGRAALAGVGFGGGLGVRVGGRRAAGARTAHRRAPPPSVLAAMRKGSSGPRPRSSGPHPGFWRPHPGAVGLPRWVPVHGTLWGGERVGGGQRPLAAMTRGA